MVRTPLFDRLARAVRIARFCDDHEISTAEGLHFVGEHADSFYSWQGFMEGAALSGLRAAGEILRDLEVGAL